MAYARFGAEGSDVYLWPGDIGYVCDLCAIALKEAGRSRTYMEHPEEAIAHLEQHRAAGHVVPESAFNELREESES
jgi:hypothetical protein